MKRDMDLLRDILAAIEQDPRPWAEVSSITSVVRRSSEEVQYHLGLLCESKLVQMWDAPTEVEEKYVYCLTWEGHDFIEAAREPKRWQKAKEIITSKGSAMILEIMKSVLVDLSKKAVGL